MVKSTYPSKTIQDILASIDALELLRIINYRVDKIESTKPFEYRCFCPIHKENIFRTLTVNDHTKSYVCSYNFCAGARGGDLIDLYAKVQQISYDDSLRALAQVFAPHLLLTDDPNNLAKSIELARNYLELNMIAESIEAYRNILAVDAFSIAAHEGLAQAYSMMGDIEQARIEIGVLMEIYSSREDYAQVVRLASRLIEFDPQDPYNYTVLIDAQYRLGHAEEAVPYQRQLAALLEQQGRHEEALDTLLHLEAYGMADAPVAIQTIRCLLHVGRTDEALQRAGRWLNVFIQSDDRASAHELGMLLMGYGVADAAMRQYLMKTLRRQGATADDLSRLMQAAEVYATQGDEAAALEIIGDLEQIAKSNLQVLESKMHLMTQLGRHVEAFQAHLAIIDRLIYDDRLDEATEHVNYILANEAGNVDALRRQVEIHEKRGDEESAMEVCWHILDALRAQEAWAEMLPIYEKLTAYEPENAAIRLQFIAALAEAGRQREAGLAVVMLAEELSEARRADEAIERLREFIPMLPGNVEIRVKLGEMLASRGDLSEAAQMHAEAGSLAHQAGQSARALALVTKATQINPAEPQHHKQLADLLLEQGESAEAAKSLKRMGEVLVEANRFEEAQEMMSQAFELGPEDTASLRTMARIYASKQDVASQLAMLMKIAEVNIANLSYQPALQALSEILKISPDHTEAMQLRIRALRQSNQTAQAIHAMRDLAQLFENQGELEAASEVYRDILKLDSTNLGTREALVRVLLRRNDAEGALREALPALEAERRLHRYEQGRELGRLLIEAQPHCIPLRQALLALEKEAANKPEAISHALALVKIHESQADHTSCVKAYRQLLELEPHNLDHRSGLVDAMMASGDRTEGAIQALRLARDLRSSDRRDEALAQYDKLLAIDPRNEAALMERAALRSEMGNAIGALEDYQSLVERYRDESKETEALAIVEKALALDKRNVALRRLAIDLKLELQDIDSAVAAYINLAEVFRVEQQRSQALEVMREAIGVKPDHLQLRRMLVEELRETGAEAEAQEAEVEWMRALIRQRQSQEAWQLLTSFEAREASHPRLAELRRMVEAMDSDTTEQKDQISSTGGSDSTPPGSTPVPSAKGRASDFLRLGPERPPVQLRTVRTFTFENFVVGNENQFAHATCLAVAREPANQYNPLFLWGSVGLGKTHLMNAIANQFVVSHPDKAVLYTSTDEFISRLIEAIQSNTVTAFRNDFRSTDLLLIDDIQFLSGKERAQEEFFHIFNVLFQAGRQIVLTSDRPPRSISHLEDRLVSRFGAGVIVDIKPPGIETRMAIVKRETLNRGLNINDEVLQLIVQRVDGSIRELKGAINQICATAEIGGDVVTIDLAQRVLDALYSPA